MAGHVTDSVNHQQTSAPGEPYRLDITESAQLGTRNVINRSLTHVPFSEAPLPVIDFSQPPWPGSPVDSGGVRLFTREVPGPADAPRCVYIHGLGGSSTNWTDLSLALSGHCRGMAVDLPGFGRTEPPAHHDFSIPAHTEVVCDFLDGLAEPDGVHLVGNSFGGAIAMMIAARRPDLVATLTLISPAMPDRRPDPRRLSDPRMVIANLPLISRKARRELAGVTPEQRTEAMLKLCFAEPDSVPEQRFAETAREYGELGKLPWIGPALGRTTAGLLKAWFAPPSRSLWRELPKIAAPTLVVWGTEDRLVSVRKAPRTAAGIPSARMLVLPNTGHVAQMERPVTVARAVLGMWEALDRKGCGEW
ncbi:alpha/beta hydrolase [Pseudonocardiaceae bacterium YIM PH 21723]|nr:alpha/beta hydrolase [Pseudonocardiaceae bacterium YIM PH 21723]